MINNLIYANVLSPAVRDGTAVGIPVGEITPAIIHNDTLVRNLALGGGPALQASDRSSVVNNLVAFNSAGISFGHETDLRRNCAFGNRRADFSGPENRLAAGGNLSLDPKLIEDELQARVHLRPDSPCRDAGDASVVADGAFDLDGQPRVQGAGVDIGCDESDGITTAILTRVVRVKPDGDDAGDGTSWGTALRTVQAAIHAAASTGGEVWVAAGLYAERIELAPLVHLLGGFRGDETSREARNWRVNESILDGQQAGSVVTLAHVDRFASLDGFTIRNGQAAEGGGILCRLFSGVIRNNLIRDNVAARGGGLAILYSSSPTVEGNRFIGNIALHDPARFPGPAGGTGGGLLLHTAPAEILNNFFLSNSAISMSLTGGLGPGGVEPGSGGAILVSTPSREPEWGQSRYDMTQALIANNTLLHNTAIVTVGQSTAHYGGGLRFSDGIEVVNNLICFNSSGAMFSRLSGPAAVRYNCVFGNGTNWLLGPGQPDPTGRNGDLAVDPLLVEAATDFHLQAASPCRDAGDSTVVRVRWRDLDGERRVQDAAVDIGADELPAAAPGRNYYSDWLAAHFSAQADPTVLNEEADPDGDGRPNLVEFAFDTNPNQAEGRPGPLRASVLPGDAPRLVLEYSRPSGVVGISYAVELSYDLRNWRPCHPNIVPQISAVRNGQVTVTYGGAGELPASAPWRFYRLQVRPVE